MCHGASVGVVEDPRPGGQERVDVIVADDQGRSEADTVGSRVVHDEAVGERRGGDLGRERTRQVQADEQAPSTDLGHALVGGQPGPETLAHRGGVLEQTVLLDGVEDGERGGAGHRVPAEGGAVVAGLQQGGRLAERDAGADRDAAAQPLGDGDDVGVGHRSGEPLAGAADAGLHLVEPEQRAVVAGDLAGGGEVRGGRDDHARLALDRLEDDGGRLVGDGPGERGLVAVRHEGDVAGQRLERRAVRLLRRQRERPHRAAVEGALGGDQVRTAGAPGELEGRLVGLGAGVGEEDPSVCTRRATGAVRPARPAARW